MKYRPRCKKTTRSRVVFLFEKENTIANANKAFRASATLEGIL
ncbi:hypothetical protein N007_03895 [Alicyclobacillus acidoterrestris ATCC 49025]|nr:hypothetical protein N007_03895 [Alicyclobacillus acidoterrestris ATCC 49025]